MAVGFDASSSFLIGEYNGRVTLYVVLSCMMAAMGGVIFGYDTGISGGVTSMDSFLKKFFPEVFRVNKKPLLNSNYCQYDNPVLTAFTSSLYVSGFFTSFLASYVTGTFGRKPSIIAGGVAFFAGSVLGGGAVNVYMLIVGRLLLGVGIGFANQAVPLYLSEMAPARFRGAISNGFQLSMSTGIIIAALINYEVVKIEVGWGWRISLGLAALPASVLILGALFLPETPNSLIQRCKSTERVKLLLQRIRGIDDVQAELDDLIDASSRSEGTKQSFGIILKPKYRPQLVMALAIPFFQQVTGVNAIGFYAPILFRTIGLGESASLLSTVMIGLVGILSTSTSMFLVDVFGRRTLFILGGIQMIVSQCIVGGIMTAALKDEGELSQMSAYLVLVFILIYINGFAYSWGPLGWLVPSEIFPLEIRSVGQSVTVATSFFFTFLVAQSFLAILCYVKAGIFFFFGGWVVVMTIFVYYFLPETKNVPIEHIESVWERHWFWGRVVLSYDNEKGFGSGSGSGSGSDSDPLLVSV